jgi:hypothetical protein
MGCCESHLTILKKNLSLYFTKKINSKFKEYNWDINVKDGFISRIAKENLVGVNVALKWVELYSFFMVYVGWLHNSNATTPLGIPKPTNDINSYLTLPYEILQVWRTHILYSDKYSEFCKIVTEGKVEFIEFTPPKYIWMTQPMET